MSEIPANLIQEIDDLLEIKGRPYRIFIDGRWKETNSYQWTKRVNPMEIMSSISPELANAMGEVQVQMTRRPSLVSKPMKRIRGYIATLYPDLIIEYDAYIARLEEFEDTPTYPTDLEPPKIPEELRTPMELISQQVKLEMGGLDFDLDGYQKRVCEFWDEQPKEIRTKLKEHQDKLIEYQESGQSSLHRDRDRLQMVRSYIQSLPYSSYGNVIVVPTDNQYDILRIEETNGANYGLQTEDLIDALKRIDNRFGIDIVGASYDLVKFKLNEPPSGEEAEQFIEELYLLCPDLKAEDEPVLENHILLWWD
jgi:hypothetical protein